MATELLAFYNVENFYPPDNGSPESYHSGLYNWDDYKYRLKVRKITNVFRLIKEDCGQLPSLIGLAEIGSRSVLEDLTKGDSPLKGYEIVYQPSPDPRQSSVALLFKKTHFTLCAQTFLRFPMPNETETNTRDILHVTFLYQGRKLHLFVLHLPSQRDRDAKRDQRHFILGQLKVILTDLLRKGEPVVIMGDFNENPDSNAIQELMDGTNIRNPFETLFGSNQFSSFHRKQGVCFDQIMFSGSLLMRQAESPSAKASIYSPPKLRNKAQKHSQHPCRTYSGSRYMGGCSDHFPVLLHLRNP